MKFRYYILLGLIVFGSLGGASPALCRPRSSDFAVPPRLKPRVDFWIDVFARYGKNHALIHHRDYPQVVFEVLDFGAEAKLLSEVKLERYRKRKVDETLKSYNSAMSYLASGKAARTELQKRIVQKMSIIPGGKAKYRAMSTGSVVRAQTGIREKYSDALVRSGRYLHIIEKIFEKDHGLPVELTRLPFVESSFDYRAYSSVGAAGIWQFMPRTAKSYMKINGYLDERRDIIAATHGAAKYLKEAYRVLGTWPLALTSYNHGVYGVARKVKQLGTKDIVAIVEHPKTRVLGFASNNFYPEFLAALEIYDDIDRFFPALKLEQPLRIAQFTLPHSVSIPHIVNKLGVSVEELKNTNYALSTRVWRGIYKVPRGYTLKVPAKYGPKLSLLRAPETSSAAVPAASSIYGGTSYRVRPGDSLSGISKKFGVSVSKIKTLNGLKSDRIRVGEILLVKEKKGASVSVASVPSKSGVHTVVRGDSLSRVAKLYGVSVSSLRAANNLSSSRIVIGQTLRIPSSAGSSTKNQARYHTVRPGESFWSISKRYKTSVSKLKSLNKVTGNTLKAGQRLRVR